VPGHRPVRRFGRPFADHHHARDPAASFARRAAWLAPRPPGAQARRQLAAQRAAALHIQRLADRLAARASPDRRGSPASAWQRSAAAATSCPAARPPRPAAARWQRSSPASGGGAADRRAAARSWPGTPPPRHCGPAPGKSCTAAAPAPRRSPPRSGPPPGPPRSPPAHPWSNTARSPGPARCPSPRQPESTTAGPSDATHPPPARPPQFPAPPRHPPKTPAAPAAAQAAHRSPQHSLHQECRNDPLNRSCKNDSNPMITKSRRPLGAIPDHGK
jgi:hypothetical protein